MALVFWDTNLFIYLLEENLAFGEQVRKLRLRMLERGDGLATSALTIGEVLVGPVRVRNDTVYKQYLSMFSQPEIRVLKFDLEAAAHYAHIRQDRSIEPPDAIQLACAASVGIDLFITNDDRLSRKNVPGIQFITSLTRAPI